MNKYDDIITRSRHVSTMRSPMPRCNRAAQFSPFAALTGYDAEINEAMRLTYPQIYLSTDMQEEINETLTEVFSRLNEQPRVSLTYFVSDERKNGGRYVTVVGVPKRYDECSRSILLTNGKKIPVDSITSASNKQ